MGLLYRPNHPRANDNGMVPREWLDEIAHDPKFYVISDTMAPTFHHAAMRHYDSKAEYRKATRAHGCVEIGNEKPKARAPLKLDRGKRVEDIKRAIHALQNR